MRHTAPIGLVLVQVAHLRLTRMREVAHETDRPKSHRPRMPYTAGQRQSRHSGTCPPGKGGHRRVRTGHASAFAGKGRLAKARLSALSPHLPWARPWPPQRTQATCARPPSPPCLSPGQTSGSAAASEPDSTVTTVNQGKAYAGRPDARAAAPAAACAAGAGWRARRRSRAPRARPRCPGAQPPPAPPRAPVGRRRAAARAACGIAGRPGARSHS